MKVLLVEDNPGDARLIQLALSETLPPCEVTVAESMAHAEPHLRAGAIDVVLLDLSLPDAHGLETLQRAQAINPIVPIVVLTGLADEQLATQAVLRGAQDFLVKGHGDEAALVRALRYAVQRRRGEEAARAALREQAAREVAEESARKLRFLSEANRSLDQHLDMDATAAVLARVAVPELGELAVVDLVDGDGRLRRAAALHGDPARAPFVAELLKHPPRQERHPVVRALTDGQVLNQADVEQPGIDGSPALVALRRNLGARSLLTLPLRARGQMLGVLSVSRSVAEPFPPETVQLAGELAQRGAMALDNARLYGNARAASQARDEMIAVLSHDLRNPLSVINMAAANLRPNADDQALRKLLKIERAVEQMSRLMADLLDVSRIESGKLQLQKEPVELRALVDEAVDQMRPLATEKGLLLEDPAHEGLGRVLCEKERVLQVFSNLVGNAIKFTPPGGSVALQLKAGAGEVRFEVRDSGPGIPAAHLPHLFDRYWQAHQARRAGAGLGLAIAKGIIEAHGGKLWAESQPGKGAAFFFTLPAA